MLFDTERGLLMKQIFTVTGMTCGHCEKAVDKAIHQVDPQAVVSIERSTGKVRIESSQAREPLAQAIVAQGYGVAD